MEDIDKKTPELARASESVSSSSDDDDSPESDSGSSSSQSSEEEQDDRRGAFDMFRQDESEEPERSPYDLFEQHADPEPPLEDLAADEQVLVADEATDLNLHAANQELVGTEPGSPEEAAAIAGATFNEAVRERLDNGEAPSEDTLDAAMEDTADIMGLDPAELPGEDEPLIPEIADEIEQPSEPGSSEAEEPEAIEDPAILADLEHEQPEDPDPLEAEDVDPAANQHPGQPGAQPRLANPNQAAANPPRPSTPGATMPGSPGHPGGGPGSPGGPVGGLPMGPGGPGGPGFGGPGFNMNMGPAFAAGANALGANPWLNPNVATTLLANRPNRRHSHLPYVLLGGVAGYLIGRRRGRIKTEKKLLPVQHRLEKQVGDMQFQLALREAKIRKLAYEKAISHPHIHAALPKRLQELQELQKARLKKDDFERADKARELVRGAHGEEVAAAGLAAKVARMADRESQSDGTKAPTRSTELAKAKDMELGQLLDIAQQIPIEDRNLRVLYESGRVSQHGLRRIIEAYLRGERFDRILREEMRTGGGIDKLSGQPDNPEHSVLPPPAVEMPEAGPSLAASRAPVSQHDPQLARARGEYFEQLSGSAAASGHGSDDERSILPWALVAVVGVVVGIVLIIFFA